MKDRLFIPISIIVLAIVMTILYFCKLEFIYYLLGGLISIVTHILMKIQNKSFYNTVSSDIGRATFHPKKSSILWYLLRLIVAFGAIVGILFMANIKDNPNKLQIIILLVSGYLTIKFMFIFYLIRFERG